MGTVQKSLNPIPLTGKEEYYQQAASKLKHGGVAETRCECGKYVPNDDTGKESEKAPEQHVSTHAVQVSDVTPGDCQSDGRKNSRNQQPSPPAWLGESHECKY